MNTKSRIYVEHGFADHRYQWTPNNGWVKLDNPMSRFTGFDPHSWEPVDASAVPARILEQYEADLRATRLTLDTQRGINEAIGAPFPLAAE